MEIRTFTDRKAIIIDGVATEKFNGDKGRAEKEFESLIDKGLNENEFQHLYFKYEKDDGDRDLF